MICLYGTEMEECVNARRFENGGHFQREACDLGGSSENVADGKIGV